MKSIPENYYIKLPDSLKDRVKIICNNSEYAIYIFYLATYINIHYIFFFQKEIQIGIQSVNLDIHLFNYNIDMDKSFVEMLNIIKQRVMVNFGNEEPIELLDCINSLFLFNTDCIEDYRLLDKLVLNVESGYDIKILYLEKFYSKALVRKIGDCYIEFIEKMLTSSNMALKSIDFTTDNDRLFFSKYSSYNSVKYENTTIQQLFKSRVKKIPNNIAVEYLNKKITYKELDERSDYLADVLLKNGAKAHAIIGILAHRSPQMLIGILAILKCGAAYLPLNSKNPLERNQTILEDANVSILLKDTNTHIQSFIGTVIEIEKNSICSIVEFDCPIMDTSSLAYVIYTSGSTGTPKGVMIEHSAVINMLSVTYEKDKATKDSVYLLMTNYCFDVSVMELFGWIYSYSKLVILPEGLEMDMKKVTETLISSKVTHMSIVPSVLEMLKRYLQSYNGNLPNTLEVISAGGECISYKLVRELKRILGDIKVVNIYGPTETTVFVSYYEADLTDDEDNVPMGKPIQNTSFYVLGMDKQLVPVGAHGELYICGKCVSRGYLNKNQTKERFINFNGEIVYRTGDTVKWSENGYLMFINRNDNQVKINGNRVELEEIERSILKFSDLIEEVSVLAIDDLEHRKSLVCFYLSKTNILVNEVVDHLTTILPKYMIPHKFKKINYMPINSNGKRDSKKLINLANDDSQALQTAFRSKLSLEVAALWKEVVGVYPSSYYDDFFMCGGDSLRAISFSLAISHKYKIDFSVADTFANSKFSDICSLVNNCTDKKYQLTNDNLIFMRKGASDQNLFLIHDVSGGVAGYISLLGHLDNRFHCWGIQYPTTNKSHPERIDIRKLATVYLKSIKAVQKNGPYNILGWSAGGTIAMAIVEELELQNEKIEFLGIIDTFIAIEKSNFNPFDVNYEVEFLNSHIPILHMYNIINRSGISEVYDSVINNIPSESLVIKPEMIKNIINNLYSNFEELTLCEKLQKFSQIRSIISACNNYRPVVNCEVYYFNAKYSSDFEQREWDAICKNRLKRFDLNENHFSIMEKDGAKEMGRIVNSILL